MHPISVILTSTPSTLWGVWAHMHIENRAYHKRLISRKNLQISPCLTNGCPYLPHPPTVIGWSNQLKSVKIQRDFPAAWLVLWTKIIFTAGFNDHPKTIASDNEVPYPQCPKNIICSFLNLRFSGVPVKLKLYHCQKSYCWLRQHIRLYHYIPAFPTYRCVQSPFLLDIPLVVLFISSMFGLNLPMIPRFLSLIISSYVYIYT